MKIIDLISGVMILWYQIKFLFSSTYRKQRTKKINRETLVFVIFLLLLLSVLALISFIQR